MGVRLIPLKTPLLALLSENTHTLVTLKANPLTVHLAPPFELFQTEWMGVHNEELLLYIEFFGAKAMTTARDADIDHLVDALSRAALTLTRGDRTAPLYLQYFATHRPSDVKKPILGPELERCRAWVPSLKASPQASLVEIGNVLEGLVANADDAVKQKATVDQKTHDFWMVGSCKTLIDKDNALR